MIAAEWGDADGDGRHDCIVAFSEAGKQFYFQPDAQGRWQQRALASPPASMQPQAVAALLAPGANALMLMHIALDDIDGDAAPERFEVRSREIRLSRGQVAKLPLPLVERERLFAAELDGQSPRELVCLQPKFGGLLELHAYRWASGKLVQIAAWRHNAELIDAHVRDLNRDGRKELILGCLLPSAKSIEIVVLDWQKGNLQKQTHSIRTPRQLQVGWYEKLEVEAQHTLYFSASARTRPLSAYLESTTLFLQVDERPEVALEPSRWRWLLQAGVPFWAGDFDGDGTVEYVLQERAEKDHTIRFVQFRNGAWRAASLKHRAPVLAVVPAPVQGKPSLVLVFADGHHESVRFGD
ncbi:MAG: hypothetical protein NZ556_09095 [Fimbriimonadales bacterium]|nr:hypothetical protein [Fimbriimonadales bacterium]